MGYKVPNFESNIPFLEFRDLQKNNLCIGRGRGISFPFQPDDGFCFPSRSSFIGPHLLAVSFSINNGAGEALKCFHLSLSDGTSTPSHYATCDVTVRFNGKNAACQLKIDCFRSSHDQVLPPFLLSTKC